MNLLYLIQCHKNRDQINTLINSLKLSEYDRVVIHVDAKNRTLQKELEIDFLHSTTVFVLQEPVNVNWSGMSQICATLKMIKYCYDNNFEFDYCSLLSGEDIVFDSIKLKDFLSRMDNKSFIEFRKDYMDYTWRINRFNFLRDNKFSRKILSRLIDRVVVDFQKILCIKRKNFPDKEIFLGSQWFTINKQHLDIFYKVIDLRFLNKFKFSACCDEHFFQILFKKYINEKEYFDFNLRHLVFNGSENSPSYIDAGDLKKISEMENIYFARKVSCETLKSYFYDID